MADFDLFEPPAPAPPVAESVFAEIKSQIPQLGNGLVQTQTGTIEIRSLNNDSWYDLSNAYLEVKFRVVKEVGGANVALDATDIGTLINSGWALFKRIELNFGDTNVIDAVDYPHRVHLVHAYSRYSASRLAEAADSEFLYPESATVTVGVDTADVNDGAAIFGTYASLGSATAIDTIGHTATDELRRRYFKRNSSFAKRYARTKQSRIVTLFLPLRSVLGYCDNLNKPIRGIPFSINLELNDEWATILHSPRIDVDPAVTLALRTVVLQTSCWLPVIKPTLEVSALINEQLSQDNLTTSYVFENRSTFFSQRYPPSDAEQFIDFKLTTSVAKPTLVYVGFLNEAMLDRIDDRLNLDTAPDNIAVTVAAGLGTPPNDMLQHLIANGGLLGSHLNDIKSVQCRIQNTQYPSDPYVMTFSTLSIPATGEGQKENWQRAYTEFKKIFFKDHPENSKIIDMATWQMGPLFAFKINNDSGIFEKSKSVDITVRANVLSRPSAFSQAGPADAVATGSGNFRVYAVVYSERQLKVQALDGRVVMYT